VADVVNLFGGPVARLYRRSLTNHGFEVLMVAVFDIAACQGYGVARSIVKELAAVPNIPLAEAWLRVLRHVRPTGLKEFLAPDEEAKWKQLSRPRWVRRGRSYRPSFSGHCSPKCWLNLG
jgi:hypothetical protein